MLNKIMKKIKANHGIADLDPTVSSQNHLAEIYIFLELDCAIFEEKFSHSFNCGAVLKAKKTK